MTAVQAEPAHDRTRLVRRSNDIRHPILGGHSLGGLVALLATLTVPTLRALRLQVDGPRPTPSDLAYMAVTRRAGERRP